MAEVVPRESPARSATAELFRLRRISVVDGFWFFGFIAAFVVAGVIGARYMMLGLRVSPEMAVFRYVFTICAAGLIGGVAGVWTGHRVATLWERWDLRRHPRRFKA